VDFQQKPGKWKRIGNHNRINRYLSAIYYGSSSHYRVFPGEIAPICSETWVPGNGRFTSYNCKV
jgi:hypothetical protein